MDGQIEMDSDTGDCSFNIPCNETCPVFQVELFQDDLFIRLNTLSVTLLFGYRINL